ncbi:MAG: hypothetical protein AAF791_09885 [Bacteroidota bacterium]
MSRTDGLPQAALASLAVPTGYVPPRLGGALGAFVQIDTRDAPRNDLGRAEGTGGLDAFGYGRATLGLGTSAGMFRVYGAGAVERADDLDPRAYGAPVLPDDELAALREAPQVIRVDRALADASGFNAARARYTSDDFYYVPLPPEQTEATREALAARFGFTDPNAIVSLFPIPSLAVRAAEVPLQTAAPASEGERLHGHLALEVTPVDALRLRFSGQGVRETGREFLTAFAFASPEALPATRDEAWRIAAEAEADLARGTLRLSVSSEREAFVRFDSRFSNQIEDVLRYGDLDDPANATASRYRSYSSSGDTYEARFSDGRLQPATVYDLFAAPGTSSIAYAQETASVRRLLASFERRLGAVDVSVGVDIERQTFRGVSVAAAGLARFVADEFVETTVVDTDGDGRPDAGITAYADLPYEAARFRTGTYGYDFLGLTEAEGTPIESFYDATEAGTVTTAPRRPMVTAGFAEGTWEQGDLTVRAGLRVARFSSNATALFDPFAAVAIYRANDLAAGSFTDPVTGVRVEAPEGGVPAGVPGSAALYVGDTVGTTDQVVGYRDLDGRFYDATGAEVVLGEVSNIGRPIAIGGGSQITADVLTDAPASLRVLPRVEAVLRPAAQTALSVFVNCFARAPDPTQVFPTLPQIEDLRRGVGFLPNGALRPETLTEAGVSAHQSLGREGGLRGEIGATLFLRRYHDRIQRVELREAFPTSYTTFVNGDRVDVPGATLRLGVQTGRLRARGTVTVVQEAIEQEVGFADLVRLESLATDAVAMLTLATESTDGPALGSLFPLGDLRLGAVMRVASGEPYTGRASSSGPLGFPEPEPLPVGTRDRTPTRARLDVRLARVVRLGPTALEISAEVINVLGHVNALQVYPATGLPDDDGFLGTDPGQIGGLATEEEREAYRSLYTARVRDPLNVGRTRLVRLGLRLDL